MSAYRTTSIVETLGRVLPDAGKPYVIHEPCFIGAEWKYLKDCLDSGWVSSQGAYVDRFEKLLADFTGSEAAVATVNGTAALHICLLLAQVKPGDEVLVPALTFVATANAVTYCGAIPHFVDSEARSLGVDAAKLDGYLAEIAEVDGEGCLNRRSGRRIRALVAVHVLGHPCDMDALRMTCERYRLAWIEDASESIGSYYKGRHTGTFELAALSFNGNKTITTGGGGAILTNDTALGRRAKHLTTTARITDECEFYHDEIGYNYRMPNVNAALGCAQIEQLQEILDAKLRLASSYEKAFCGAKGLALLREPEYARSNYWLNALVLEGHGNVDRTAVLAATGQAGYVCRALWQLMHRLPMYGQCPRMDLSVAEDLQKRVVILPSSPSLGLRDRRNALASRGND